VPVTPLFTLMYIFYRPTTNLIPCVIIKVSEQKKNCVNFDAFEQVFCPSDSNIDRVKFEMRV
jgi:hypothetical protein